MEREERGGERGRKEVRKERWRGEGEGEREERREGGKGEGDGENGEMGGGKDRGGEETERGEIGKGKREGGNEIRVYIWTTGNTCRDNSIFLCVPDLSRLSVHLYGSELPSAFSLSYCTSPPSQQEKSSVTPLWPLTPAREKWSIVN